MYRIALVCLLAGVAGCNTGKPAENATIGDLIEHMRSSGIPGDYYPSNQTFAEGNVKELGADEYGSFLGGSIECLVLHFPDESKAKSLEKTGLAGGTCHRNGKFVIMVRGGEEKVISAFKQFGRR